MSEVERDPRVAGLLAAAADEAAPHIRPPGADAVMRTVRRRRTRTVSAVALLVLVAILTPVAVFAFPGRPAPNPPIENPPSPSVSATPSPSESPKPKPPPSSPPSRPTATGGIPAAQLRDATLRIPAWPEGFAAGSCPTGAVKFTDGKAGRITALQGDPAYVDVDHDGARETVVLVSCSSQGSDYQVLALGRDKAGKIRTLGKVVGSAGNTGEQGTDIMTIWAVAAGDDGQVRVDMGEYRPCCAAAQASQHQWRTYGWNGKRFTQTGGPAEFGPNPKVTDLTIVADRVTMTKQSDGSWAGTMRVTIHNAAEFETPGKLEFILDTNSGLRARLSDVCSVTPGVSPPSCTLPRLGKGADRVLTIRLTAPASFSSAQYYLYARAQDANGLGYPDRKPDGATKVQVVRG